MSNKQNDIFNEAVRESLGEKLRGIIFDVLDGRKIDVSDISNGRTHIDSTEARELTESIIHKIIESILE